MHDIDHMKKIRDMLSRITEDAQSDTAEPAPQDQVADQPALDRDIEDVMTQPRMPSPDDDDIAGIANDLKIGDAEDFVKAFNQMRSATDAQDAETSALLVAAFRNLLSADTSTAQRSINRLRKIYKRS